VIVAPYTLQDVTYDITDSTSINDAVDLINAGTVATNITATVGADGSNNAGKIVLAHNGDAAAGIGEHGSLATVFTAYDTENSAAAATIAVNGQEGILSFHEDAGTAFKLVLARVNCTGDPQETFTIDTTADLQIAVDAINGSSGAGTTAHGYTAEVVAAADGSTVGGTIKLTSGSADSNNTQVSFSSLDLGRVGDTSQTMPLAADGVFDATTGVFTPGNVNTSGTVNLTLGDTEVTVSGISNKGADASGDAAKIAAAISAGNHGYTAAAMTGADTGKVKITQPSAPTKDMDVNSADKARESIVAIDNAIRTVNIQRSSLGAVSNRLSHTINNLTNISSNLSAAQGGIEDADFAHETTMLAKNQILQQASTAMLAQANASKQNVLSLLQG
jgi:flagellin